MNSLKQAGEIRAIFVTIFIPKSRSSASIVEAAEFSMSGIREMTSVSFIS